MKRIFLILFAVLLTGRMMLQAEPVSESRAREVAMKVLAAQPATKAAAADVKLIWDGEEAATKAAFNPAFYVFGSDRGGFVIIAGDDNVQPVLAISETSQFKVEGMPENVRWWMERMKAYVRSAAVPTPEARDQWAKFADTKSDPILENNPRLSGQVICRTPEWDQGNNDNSYFGRQVFNAMCPLDGGIRSVTGCVATALGELLTVLRALYPDDMPTHASVTELDGYSVPSGYVPAAAVGNTYTLATQYYWSDLLTLANWEDILEKLSNETLMDNLAHLLADLGAMVQARYSKSGTSAATELAPEAMAQYMGFNKGAYIDYESNYTTRQWKEKIKNELDRRPILYSGADEHGGGHAFVLDGYALFDGATDMFYVNFGWGGTGNGYYVIDDFGDYKYTCEAAFDFYPKSESSYIYSLQYDDSYLPGLSFENPFSESDWFIITYGVANVGTTDYSGKMQVKLLNKDDVWKADFAIYTDGGWSDEFELPLGYRGYDYLLIKLTGSPTIEFGDKIVIYCTTDAGQSVFAPIKERNDGTVLNSLPIVPAAFIKAKASYNAGEYFPLELKNYDYLFAGTVWTITKEGGSPVVLDQAEREYQFTEAGTYKIEAAVKESASGAVVETITTYVTVN